jgi:hypothetical protein
MRSDMDKVIVERPRHGAGWSRKGRQPKRLSDHPLRENAAHRRRRMSKGLNENLAPLKRFLHKQVNRPWNTVYGEIRSRIKPGNTVQEHVLSHIPQLIHLEVVKVAPSRTFMCGLGYQPRHGPWPLRPGEVYVDPEDGIIKRARRKVSPR